jgi:hypothetical protein
MTYGDVMVAWKDAKVWTGNNALLVTVKQARFRLYEMSPGKRNGHYSFTPLSDFLPASDMVAVLRTL